jgi:hypothetical protein
MDKTTFCNSFIYLSGIRSEWKRDQCKINYEGKEGDVVWFNVLFGIFVAETENIHGEAQSGLPALGFEPSIFEYESFYPGDHYSTF